jgi:glutamine transport system substrate-binding protein
MKKRIMFVLVGLLCISMLAACGGNSDTYTVATDNGFIPFEFIDEESGDLVGFDIDLIQAIADEAGFEIEFETMEFTGVVAGIQAERYDIGIAGMTITEERKETIDFSDPYYDAGLMLAVQTDEEEIASEADLDGKKVGTRAGTTSVEYLEENHPGAEVVDFPDIVTAYMDLASGRLDAVLYDVPNVQYYASTEGEGRVKTVGDVLQGEQYGIALPQGSELLDDVNEALEALKSNGTYDDIYEKWFGDRPMGT